MDDAARAWRRSFLATRGLLERSRALGIEAGQATTTASISPATSSMRTAWRGNARRGGPSGSRPPFSTRPRSAAATASTAPRRCCRMAVSSPIPGASLPASSVPLSATAHASRRRSRSPTSSIPPTASSRTPGTDGFPAGRLSSRPATSFRPSCRWRVTAPVDLRHRHRTATPRLLAGQRDDLGSLGSVPLLPDDARRAGDHRRRGRAFRQDGKRDALIPAKAKALAAKAGKLFPRLDAAPVFAWAGTFGGSETGLPTIAPIPGHPACWAVLGYGGNGTVFSRLAAEIIRTALAGGTDPDAELFGFRPPRPAP